jgi:hypothetical protein
MSVRSGKTDPETTRAAGNIALTAAALLVLLNAVAYAKWLVLACVVLTIVGVGLRIEAAIGAAAARRTAEPDTAPSGPVAADAT